MRLLLFSLISLYFLVGFVPNKANANDAYEALLLRDGFLTEGSASNIFIVNRSSGSFCFTNII